MSLTLIDFVRQLADDMVLAPIYRKGAVMRSGASAKGKNPHEDALDRNLNKHDAALLIEKSPKTLTAVGLWTGIRGNGYVILDVDRNLYSLKKKWGDALQGAPVITSTKKNAAKYIFRVPEALWTDVDGFGLSEETGNSYEVLWGGQGFRQGLIYGAYPGSLDGKAPEGSYGFVGDPDNIPTAPDFLIAEMKAAKAKEGKRFISKRRALDVSDRTEDEIAEIVMDCLKLIPHKGVGSNQHWVKVGMAIHSVLPADTGLVLWSEWSAKDPEFADEWKEGNPCEKRWDSFKPGGISLGTLIWMADQVDPKRARFSKSSKSIVETAESRIPQLYRESLLSYDEIIRRGMAAYQLDDVARMNYELHTISKEAGYKDQSGIEKLLLDHITQQNRADGHTMANRKATSRDFLIPGLLPYAYTVLFFGEAGCGKSATAMVLLKHVVDGIPFQLKNHKVPVTQGPVIYFNADMSLHDFYEEYDLHEIKNGHDFHFQPDFNLYRQAQFVKKMNAVKPSMIVIDSLSSCSGAKAGDENKAEFAQPLYWLNTNNGVLWPAATIIVLHHAAKAGGARGSSAITAAVGEVWNIGRPSKDSNLSSDQRVITIGKSRINREGECLVQTQNEDLTVSLAEIAKPEEIQTRAASVGESIMIQLHASGEWMSRQDINSHQFIKGSVAAKRKTLQRLENRGLLMVMERPSAKGKNTKLYKALSTRAHGESIGVSHLEQTPCSDRDVKWDTPPGTEKCPIKSGDEGSKWDTSTKNSECPIKESSADEAFCLNGTVSNSPRAREEDVHTKEELETLRNNAWNYWGIQDTPEVQVLDHGEEKRKQAETFFASAQAPAEPVVIDVPVNPPTLERD
jgi:hypothetical protein